VPSTDKWIMKMWYIFTFHSKNEVMLFVGKWMELAAIILSKINLTQKDKYTSPLT
jgi:hypothetical protein